MFDISVLSHIDQPKVIILVGPPLSGKDTFLNSHDFNNYTIISRDNILLQLSGYDSYALAFNNVNQKLVDKILVQKINDSISNRENVIINMTNLTKKSRNKHISKFPKSIYYKIAIVFPKLDIIDYINRNEGRLSSEDKFIPLSVIENMIGNWTDITPEEGFDTIIKL